MNQAAANALAAVEGEVQEPLAKLSERLTDAALKKLKSCQALWVKVQRCQAEYEAGAYEGGSIYPLIYADAAKRIAELRRDVLQEMLDDELQEQQIGTW